MSGDPFEAVAAGRRDAARLALATAMGSTAPNSLSPLSGGASGASIFRVESKDGRYLLRIEGPPSPLRNPHQYISMRMASDAGIAPMLLHLDEPNGIVVTQFIEERPLKSFPGGRPALAEALGALLGRLQASPVFPYFVDYPALVIQLIAHVDRTGLFAPGLLDVHWNRLADIANKWKPETLVSSHNDPNPRNILFDGERLWLIDWESAYRNDPFIDIAIVLDSLAPTPQLEDIVLRAWLGRAPDAAFRERLDIARALIRLYYAGVLLSASATLPRAQPDGALSAPTLPQLRSAIAEGRIKTGTAESLHTVGKMYLAAFLSGEPVLALDEI